MPLLQEGVYLDEILIIGLTYYLRQSYAEKDRAKIQQYGLRDIKRKWNNKYSHRFRIQSATLDNAFITLEGICIQPESFHDYNIDNFWGGHIHIENIHDYDAYYFPEDIPEDPIAPEEKQAMMLSVWIIGIVVIGIIGFVAWRILKK